MLNNDFLQFLYDLSQNNNRDWFEKNKKRYEASVKKPFEALVGEILQRLSKTEPEFALVEPKNCIFRIYRDTRFSADKSPYKTHIAAVFVPQGKKSMEDLAYPGYYLHLEYGNLSIGGGAYFLDKEPLRKLRTAIMHDPAALRKLLSEASFVEKYGGLKGEVNKVLPPEFKEAAKSEPLLANKQFYFMADMDPEIALRTDFPDVVADYFRIARPLNEYFRRAIFSE